MKLFNNVQESLVELAKSDPNAREELINQEEQAILKVASKMCSKYVTKSDDEWSVALYAFSQAIDGYEKERGDFMAFATTVIKRSLIDYHRKEEHFDNEYAVSPSAFGDEFDEEDSEVSYAVAKKSMEVSNSQIQDEIATLTTVLSGFGFGFMDLTQCSPKQEKTRNECLKVATSLSSNNALFKKMIDTHQLPASELIKQTGVSSKALDKYRKYIIASAIILSDDYPFISQYLMPMERRKLP